MAVVSAKAPLTWSAPPETVALPPAPPPCDSQVPLCPAGGQRRAAGELRADGRVQGHLAVAGLGDVGVGVRGAGAEVGGGGVGEIEDVRRRSEAPGVIGPERVAVRVGDGAGNGDVVDGVRVEVGVGVEGRRVARVGHRRRDVGARALFAQADGRGVDRGRIHRLAELRRDVRVGGDPGRVREREPADDRRRRGVGAGVVARRHLAQGRGRALVGRAQVGAVLQVARIAGDVAAVGGDRGERAPAPVRGRRVAGADAEDDRGPGGGVGDPRQRAPVGALAGVEDPGGEAAGARIGAHVQPIDRDVGATGVEVAGGRAHLGGAEVRRVGDDEAAVDVVADLARVPLDPVVVRGADQRAWKLRVLLGSADVRAGIDAAVAPDAEERPGAR